MGMLVGGMKGLSGQLNLEVESAGHHSVAAERRFYSGISGAGCGGDLHWV